MKRRERCDPGKMLFQLPPKRDTTLSPNVSLYSPHVLLNNWTEDRFQYEKQPLEVQHYKTVYNSDFRTPYPYIPKDHKGLLDRIIQHGGRGHDMMLTHEDEKYQKNVSTTYDLTHNHFPKLPLKKKELPFPRFIPRANHHEMLDCYGNITRYGLVDYKKYMWDLEEKETYVKTTEYTSRYVAPRVEDLESARVAIPKSLSSALNDVNVVNKNLKIRGRHVGLVPEMAVDVERYRSTCGLSCLDPGVERHRGMCPPC